MNVHVVTDPRLRRPSEFPMKYFLLRADCTFFFTRKSFFPLSIFGGIFKNDSFVSRRNAFCRFFAIESPQIIACLAE